MVERLLKVIDEGRRTATYELALLVALIDSVVGSVEPVRAAATSRNNHTLAEVRRALPTIAEATIDRVETSYVAGPFPDFKS